jgi:lysine-specific demethylase 3
MNELQMRRDKHLHSNPFFLTCLKRNEHGAKDFSPMTRFSKPELVEAIRNMEQLLQDEGISIAERPVSVPVTVGSDSSDHASTSDSSSGVHMPPHIAPSRSVDSDGALIANGEGAHLYTQPTSPIASGSSSTPPEIPSHEILRFKDSELTEEIFRPLWAKGEPLLVTEVGAKLKINWSPGYFMKKYGTQNCLIIECQTEDNKRITVGEFFTDFGQYEGRDKCWKLKVGCVVVHPCDYFAYRPH